MSGYLVGVWLRETFGGAAVPLVLVGLFFAALWTLMSFARRSR